MSSRVRFVAAISAGFLAQYLLMVPTGFDSHWGNSSSIQFWISPLQGLKYIVPGLVAGLLAKRHGIIVGALSVGLAEVARHFVWFDYPGSGAYVPLGTDFSWFTVRSQDFLSR